MSAPLIVAQGLQKSFGETEVLKEASFSVSPGEFVCIWGPSGAGKSTLLHMLGLMTPPSGGSLSLFGTDAGALTQHQAADLRNRRIGFLFQFHHLLPDFSIMENVMIPLMIGGISRQRAEAAARPLLERLGLGHRRSHRPSETSGGEQQRTSLARALIGGPSLVLADEPTGNLDRQAGALVETLLQDEIKSRGAALILVTHNEQLAALADRRLTLIDGVLKGD